MSSLRFGPEWMRKPSRTQLQPSPEPITNHNSAPPPSSASYSALVSPTVPTTVSKRDQAHPFRYSKEELVRIYKEGGGRGGLGLEVDRWEGVTHEIGSEPVSLREMTEEEKKHFAGSLNSELRRRQSTDYLSPLSTQNLGVDRPRLNHTNSGAVSPMRERFGGLGIKRRDSSDTNPISIPRKLSLSSTQGPLGSPGLPSPRTRTGQSPGFDGVLSGDSWLARKRASDAKMNGTAPRGVPGEDDDKRPGIPEEDISHTQPTALEPDDDPIPLQTQAYDTMKLNDPGQPLETNFVNIATNHSAQNSGAAVDSPVAPIGPPPGLGLDLASIEWSYLDPQGQIQGPFRADLMQKWYDDGYFAANLHMRRTHLDSDWTTVAELSRRAGNDKPFLSPLTFAPPGLTNHADIYATRDPISYNAPYQPSPIRTARAATLDTYLNPSPVPASPASSFGAGRSPDPTAFNGRGVIGEAPVNSRVLNFQTSTEMGFGAPRRAPFNDASSYKGFPNRAATLDSHGFGSSYHTANSPWPAPTYDHHLSNHSSASSSPFLTHLVPQPSAFDNSVDRNVAVPSVADVHGASMFTHHSDITNLAYNNIQTSVQQPITQEQASPLYPTQVPVSTEPQPITEETSSAVPADQASWPPSPIVPPPATEPPAPPVEAPALAPAPVPAPAKAWNTVAKPSRQVEPSPWYIASTVDSDDQWKEIPDSEASVPQPSETQSVQEVVKPILPVDISKPEPPSAKADAEVPAATTPSPVEPPAAPPAKQARKASTSAAAKPTVTTKVTPAPAPAPATTPKTAWSTEDDKKSASAPMSLREIQEAEAKKAEAKKLADRERERAARAASAASPATEDSAPFTTSWGLPTSQAGARNNTSKDATTPNATTPTTSTPTTSTPPAVWTTPKTQTAKKSMKEIQEEEEKRKKMATKESVAQAASRRAYAESTAKPTPLGNAWTTVGPSGKTNPVAAAPARPPVITNASAVSSTVVPRVNGTVAAKQAAAITAKPITPAARAAEDFPAAPSHEFLKWLGEALKGLNSSVNVEEIISMLLSFPVEPDSSTLEIISDLIYANSTTLDGRRFANDFASRRKADAARPKAGGTSAAKIVSIADVVKAQPKPTQPEWGFKVVNKKKKGGRA